jgi:hypothetical protein
VGASTALEAWVGPLAPGAWAAQALLAAGLALALRLLLAPLGAPRAGQGTLVGLAWFASLVPIHHLNVEVLPSTHFLAPRSLLLDAAVLGTASLLALATHRLAARVPGIRVLAAALALPLLLASALTLEREWPRDRQTPQGRHAAGPDLLLVVVDSARSDHLGLHGYARPTSPSLDALGSGARVYEDAWAASSWTLPTMLEVLRGAGSESLAATLARQGYVTACFTDNPHLRPGTLVTEGFDIVRGGTSSWRRLLRGSSLGAVVERLLPPDDRRLVDRALSWAGTVRGPIFLYVHLMDSHAPFRFPAIDGQARPGRRIEFPQTGMKVSAGEAADIVARYDGGLRSADREVGRLVAALRARGPFLALITADHGESLGEGTRWFHGQTLAPELLRVPLLALGEGVEPGRVDSLARRAGPHPAGRRRGRPGRRGARPADQPRHGGGRGTVAAPTLLPDHRRTPAGRRPRHRPAVPVPAGGHGRGARPRRRPAGTGHPAGCRPGPSPPAAEGGRQPRGRGTAPRPRLRTPVRAAISSRGPASPSGTR